MENEKTELFWKDKNLQQERRGSNGETLLGRERIFLISAIRNVNFFRVIRMQIRMILTGLFC